ncbi:unnamed protein product [Boreogadus saida]
MGICVCMCVCTYACGHVSVCVCACMNLCMNLCACMCACVLWVPYRPQVVYRETWQGRTRILETNGTSVELQVPSDEEQDYFIHIKVLTDGGDGGSSGPIRIPKMSSLNSKGSDDPKSRWICCFVLLIVSLMTY